MQIQTVREVIFFIMCLGEYCAVRWLLLPQMTDRTLPWQERLKLWLPTLIVGALFAYNGLGSFVSTGVVFFFPIMSGILYFIFNRKYVWNIVIWEFFSLTLLSLIKCMILVLEGLAQRTNIVVINHEARSLTEVIVEVMLMGLLIWAGKLLKGQKISLSVFSKRYWKCLLLGSIASEEIMGYIMANSLDHMDVSLLLLNVITIFACIFLILMFLLQFAFSQMKQERNMLDYQQRSTQEYYEELRRQYEKLGKINHDIKNERACIYHLLEEGNTEKAKDFLQEKKRRNSELRQIWTGDSMTDFMVNLKHGEMVKRGILFQLDSEFTESPTSQEDCCILLGNLLDNAIEAAEKCREGARWIRLEFHQHNEIFLLVIKNSSSQLPKLQGRSFRTTKKEQDLHGWGLQNVEDLVNKYGGTIKYDYSETYFEVKITFWNIDKKEGEKNDGTGKRYAGGRQSGI